MTDHENKGYIIKPIPCYELSMKEVNHTITIALADHLSGIFKELKVFIRAKEKPDCPNVKFVERLEEVVRDARKEADDRKNS